MKRIILSHKKEQSYILKSFYFIINHLASISMIFMSLGFINLWFYLKSIGQLSLLPLVASSPSTLFSIFASSCAIIIISLFILILPAVFMFMLFLIDKNNINNKEIIIHNVIISFLLVILGTIENLYTALALTTFFISFYFCYFIYSFYYRDIKVLSKNLLKSIAINIPIFITLLIINSKISSSYHETYIRLLVLFLYALISYFPIFAMIYILRDNRMKSRQIAQAITFVILLIMYFSITFTPGFYTKLNNLTISYSGLKSDAKYLYKISKETYPDGWIEKNFDNIIYEKESIWVEGYPIFQNNDIILLCPESSYNNIQENINKNITILNKNKGDNTSETIHCILIQNSSNNKTTIKINK